MKRKGRRKRERKGGREGGRERGGTLQLSVIKQNEVFTLLKSERTYSARLNTLNDK